MGRILKLSGSIAVIELDTRLGEMIYLGEEKLLGEVLRVEGNTAIVQSFEDLTGLRPNEPAVGTGRLLEFQLGPGMLTRVFDGLQRSMEAQGDDIFLKRGKGLGGIPDSKWKFEPSVKKGDMIQPGQAIGSVQEGPIDHKILPHPGVKGEIEAIKKGTFGLKETVAIIGGIEVQLSHQWPVRKPRYLPKLPPTELFVTGQRVIDMLFPLTVGGSALVPGGFGTGKTQLLFQLVRYAPIDIVIYVGCGERGNEIIQLMTELNELEREGMKLSNRTILIANTSNMPVAARSASIFAGITVAEYFRDQGKNALLVTDSLSRWAEAEREVASRMGIIPGEGGYPPYMATQLAEFFERSGKCMTPQGKGSVTLISSVSPTGGDITEPVTQAAMKTAGSILVLNNKLAYRRHYPAIDWTKSFSNYRHEHEPERLELQRILSEASELEKLAGIVGLDNLSDQQQVHLWFSELIKEAFLRQNAFHPIDKFCPHEDQVKISRALLHSFKKARDAMHIPHELYEKMVNSKLSRGEQLDDLLEEIGYVET